MGDLDGDPNKTIEKRLIAIELNGGLTYIDCVYIVIQNKEPMETIRQLFKKLYTYIYIYMCVMCVDFVFRAYSQPWGGVNRISTIIVFPGWGRVLDTEKEKKRY